MKTIRIPLVGSLTNRNVGPAVSSLSVNQFFDNCFPDITKNPLTGKGSAVLMKRPGINSGATVEAGATGLYGVTVWTGGPNYHNVITSARKSGTTSTMIFEAGNTKRGGDIPNTSSVPYIDETIISSTATLTASITDSSTGDVKVYFFQPAGTWTQVTSAVLTTSSSPICPDHCHIDGYMVVMRKDGQIYHSALNTVSSWPATNFITANSFADKGVGVTRYKNTVVAFGDYSTEFYYNVGNATGSVLSRITNADIRIGCISRNNDAGRVFIPVGDTIYWIGLNPETGLRAIYRLKGYAAEKISTPTVERMFTAVPTANALFIAGSFYCQGMTHLMLGTNGEPSMLCYCIESNFWWRFSPGGSLAVSAVIGGSGGLPDSANLVTPSNAVVYSFSGETVPLWQDATSTYTMTVQTENMDLETDRKKYWKKLRATYDRQANTSPITVFASDNDYGSFSTLGSIDTVSTNAQSWITRLGASRRRSWKFTHSTNTACRIQAIEIDYEVGSS